MGHYKNQISPNLQYFNLTLVIKRGNNIFDLDLSLCITNCILCNINLINLEGNSLFLEQTRPQLSQNPSALSETELNRELQSIRNLKSLC